MDVEVAGAAPSEPRPDRWVSASMAMLGVVFLIARPELTAWRWLDVGQLLVAGLVLPLLIRRATWSVVALGCCGALVASAWTIPIVGASIGLAVHGWVTHRDRHITIAAATCLVVLALKPLHRSTWTVGWLVGLGIVLLVVDVASARRRGGTSERRVARLVLVGAGVLVALVAVQAVRLAGSASSLGRELRLAVDSMRAGDIDTATSSLDATSAHCGRVRSRLGGPPGLVMRLVPGLGAQVRHGSSFARLCRDDVTTLGATVRELRTILRPVDQRFDLTAVARVGPLVRQARGALGRLHDSAGEFVGQLPIPRAPSSVTSRLATIAAIDRRLGDVEDLLDQLPELFGANGRRRYFVMRQQRLARFV